MDSKEYALREKAQAKQATVEAYKRMAGIQEKPGFQIHEVWMDCLECTRPKQTRYRCVICGRPVCAMDQQEHLWGHLKEKA